MQILAGVGAGASIVSNVEYLVIAGGGGGGGYGRWVLGGRWRGGLSV